MFREAEDIFEPENQIDLTERKYAPQFIKYLSDVINIYENTLSKLFNETNTKEPSLDYKSRLQDLRSSLDSKLDPILTKLSAEGFNNYRSIIYILKQIPFMIARSIGNAEMEEIKEEAKGWENLPRDQREEFRQARNENNINGSKWQQEVSGLLFSLVNNPEAESVMDNFWNCLQRSYDFVDPALSKEAKIYKSGIISQTGFTLLMTKLGYEVFNATAEEDALGKVDLWLKKQNTNWQQGFTGIQIKTHGPVTTDIDANFVDENFITRMPVEKERKSAGKLLTTVEAYGSICSALWIDLVQKQSARIGDIELRKPIFNPTTGALNTQMLERPEIQEQLESLQEVINKGEII